jgi:cell division septal protein FtsQ
MLKEKFEAKPLQDDSMYAAKYDIAVVDDWDPLAPTWDMDYEDPKKMVGAFCEQRAQPIMQTVGRVWKEIRIAEKDRIRTCNAHGLKVQNNGGNDREGCASTDGLDAQSSTAL